MCIFRLFFKKGVGFGLFFLKRKCFGNQAKAISHKILDVFILPEFLQKIE